MTSKLEGNEKKISRKALGQMLIPRDVHDFEMMQPFEMCRCRHIRWDHGDTIAQGHGRCMYGNGFACSCNRFTFTGRYILQTSRGTRP